ncbi:helix-turn-helix domain-containing protein [Xylanibacillus composti]|uniref:helix-turn-helix domain-containing protein n=1 Tax=Xylanibacillus composti TaxID=1572762 RepID=UPI0024549061|nr:helix-turn-helix domain-containing protein [Xylanibacillus composti]
MQECGVRPKELLDIVRFQGALRELYQQASPSFADIAIQYGYYDQSHLIQHFKRYYGMSPGQICW